MLLINYIRLLRNKENLRFVIREWGKYLKDCLLIFILSTLTINTRRAVAGLKLLFLNFSFSPTVKKKTRFIWYIKNKMFWFFAGNCVISYMDTTYKKIN